VFADFYGLGTRTLGTRRKLGLCSQGGARCCTYLLLQETHRVIEEGVLITLSRFRQFLVIIGVLDCDNIGCHHIPVDSPQEQPWTSHTVISVNNNFSLRPQLRRFCLISSKQKYLIPLNSSRPVGVITSALEQFRITEVIILDSSRRQPPPPPPIDTHHHRIDV
jgi:hypothetical protein